MLPRPRPPTPAHPHTALTPVHLHTRHRNPTHLYIRHCKHVHTHPPDTATTHRCCAEPLIISLRADPRPAVGMHASGFQLREDVPGKPGYIGTELGATLTLALSAVGHGMTYLGALHAYDKMGSARITLTIPGPEHGECVAAAKCTPNEAGCIELATRGSIDFRWHPRIRHAVACSALRS